MRLLYCFVIGLLVCFCCLGYAFDCVCVCFCRFVGFAVACFEWGAIALCVLLYLFWLLFVNWLVVFRLWGLSWLGFVCLVVGLLLV